MKEGYVLTSREEFAEFLDGIEAATVIVEASSTIDRIVSFLLSKNISVANPAKVRLIAESMNKTDRNDAHILLELFKREYIEEAIALKMNIICGVIKDREMMKILLAMERTGIYSKENRVSLKSTHVIHKVHRFHVWEVHCRLQPPARTDKEGALLRALV